MDMFYLKRKLASLRLARRTGYWCRWCLARAYAVCLVEVADEVFSLEGGFQVAVIDAVTPAFFRKYTSDVLASWL